MKNFTFQFVFAFIAGGSLTVNDLQAQNIAGGINFSVSICNDNKAMAWGYGGEGQLGDSTHSNSAVPVQVKKLTNLTAVSSGGAHTLALKSDGTVWSWGYNVYSSLGCGTPGGDRDTAVQVSGLSNVIAISAGGYHSLALKSDGTVWSWGSNFAGEIGDGTVSTRATPVQVTGISGIVAISAGDVHSMALKSDGTLYTWGFNSDGRLGDGTTTNRFSPVIAGITNVSKISGGGYHSVAVKNDGTVWCWGKNDFGQLGNGTMTNSITPVQVTGLTNVASVDAGERFSLVIKTDGTVWGWGKNANGELGDGTTATRTTPVQATGISSAMTVNCGMEHSLVLKTDGTLWAFGADGSGQLCDGGTTDVSTAVQATGLCTVSTVNTGIADAPVSIHSSVYPNPSSGMITLETSQQEGMLTVSDITGRAVMMQRLFSKQELDLSALPAGVYFIRALSKEGCSTHRIVIAK